ncbi:MAG TPA: hypothetical protein VIW69_05675 [Candidatus Elarobacter sp.]
MPALREETAKLKLIVADLGLDRSSAIEPASCTRTRAFGVGAHRACDLIKLKPCNVLLQIKGRPLNTCGHQGEERKGDKRGDDGAEVTTHYISHQPEISASAPGSNALNFIRSNG